MNKYTELSDFEINKKIAEKLGLDYWGAEPNIYVDDYIYSPCANPIQAMPIIIENKISMYFVSDDIGWAARDSDTDYGELECIDKNYYRAAMILFLLMKDAENEG